MSDVSKDKLRGLYSKYRVERLDRRDVMGEKHFECDYFVLDLTHDKYAKAALAAYAVACAMEYPELAKDLVEKTWKL